MKNIFSKKVLSLVLAVVIITVTTVFAAPTVTELVKYQVRNEVTAFTLEEFENSYNGTSSLKEIVIEDLPDRDEGLLEINGERVSEGQKISADEISNLTFTPTENFLGEAEFEYRAYDGADYSDDAEVVIKYVENISDTIPTAMSFSVDAEKNTSATATLNYNYEGEEVLSYTIFEAPKKGSIEIVGNDGEFIYTPYADQIGSDSFSFRVSTSEIDSNVATCDINIGEKTEEAEPFSFVYQDTINHWVNYSAVKMVEKDIYKGERIGNKYYFRPDALMTRIDIINYILAALDVDTDDVDMDEIHVFTDSRELPDYINKSAYKAYKLGIIDGQKMNGGVYLNPYTNVTRAELVKMIDKAMGPKTRSDNKLDYIDSGSVPGWAEQYFKNMIAYGIINGYDDNSLKPNAFVTKAQATEMLYQMVKYNEANTPTLAQRVMSGFYLREEDTV